MNKIFILTIFIFLIIIAYIYNSLIDNYTSVDIRKTKTLVLYTFHQNNNNVSYFIKNGIFKDDNVDFILICNDENTKVDCPDYVKVLNRPNIGYDFGGWTDGLLTNNLYKNYDNFIFVNSSVLGPFVPSYYKNKWTDIFISGLTNDIKLFGSTINTCGYNSCDINTESHVQSYAFCIDRNTLEYLISKNIFSKTNITNDHIDTVINKEIKMSREIINNNWNIGSMLKIYDNIDFRLNNSNIDLKLNDLAHLKMYNEYLHPYEVIFIKEKYCSNKEWINVYIKN